MTTTNGEQPTAQQYLRDLHYAQGLSYAEIARRLGRSPRLLFFVASGQKPGRNLVPALRELAVTGQITAEPERRTTTSGQPARVRGRRGHPSVAPPPPRRRQPQPDEPPDDEPDGRPEPPTTATRPPSRSGQQPDFTVRDPEASDTLRVLSDVNPATLRGNHSLQAPKSRSSFGRWQANDALAKIARDAARLGLRLHASIHVETGRGRNRRRRPPIRIGGNGGYAATNVNLAIQAEGGDSFAWLASQIEDRYPEFQTEQWTVIGVDIDVW